MALAVQLANGGSAVGTSTPSGFTVQRTDTQGAATGPAFTQTAGPLSAYTLSSVTPLATGGYVVEYALAGALLPGYILFDATFDSQGQAVGAPVQANAPQGEGSLLPDGVWSIAALPDGGFVTAWEDGLSTAAPIGALYIREFGANGQPIGAPVSLGSATNATPVIEAQPDGRYVVSWTSPTGSQHQVFTEQSPALNSQPASEAPATPAQLQAAGAPLPIVLTETVTAAAVLTGGALVVVGSQDLGGGAKQAAEQTFDSSGAQTSSASLRGFADADHSLQPMVTALPGGFYEVTYAGSGDLEIYNAAGQQAFVHNVFTSPTAAFAPLLNGGYVLTDSASSVFGLVDANNATVGWFSVPDIALGAVTVHGLDGGGFVLTHADSTRFNTFDAAGHALAAGDFGASVSGFATGLAALPGGGFVQAWLSADGGSGGLPSSVDVQAFDASGQALSGALTLGQDLDPWHTQFKLQAHADGSAAVLFSQGGGLWGAEFAGGAVGPVHALGIAVALSDAEVIALPNDHVGVVFLQGGSVWAEIFDPTTGAAQRSNLGAATGDLSTVHGFALADGGIAVSWHSGAAVDSNVLTAAGQIGSVTVLPGDLLGVDAHGAGLILAQGGGSAQLLHYQPDGGLFWT